MQPGTAASLRRLWRHPVTGTAAEVQLILGKTLEQKLGGWVGGRLRARGVGMLPGMAAGGRCAAPASKDRRRFFLPAPFPAARPPLSC